MERFSSLGIIKTAVNKDKSRAYIGLEPNAPLVKLRFAMFITERVRLKNFLTFKLPHSTLSTIQPHNPTAYVKFTLHRSPGFPNRQSSPSTIPSVKTFIHRYITQNLTSPIYCLYFKRLPNCIYNILLSQSQGRA